MDHRDGRINDMDDRNYKIFPIYVGVTILTRFSLGIIIYLVKLFDMGLDRLIPLIIERL